MKNKATVVTLKSNAKASIGILMTSDRHADYLMNLVSAALERNVLIRVFLAGSSVTLCGDPRFETLARSAEVSVCDDSFRLHGFHDPGKKLPGMDRARITTHKKHAEILGACDRYLVF